MTDEYLAWFRAELSRWIAANPQQYEQLQEAEWNHLRRAGQPFPAKGTFSHRYLMAAVCEDIRAMNRWPSERQHESGTRLPIPI